MLRRLVLVVLGVIAFGAVSCGGGAEEGAEAVEEGPAAAGGVPEALVGGGMPETEDGEAGQSEPELTPDDAEAGLDAESTEEPATAAGVVARIGDGARPVISSSGRWIFFGSRMLYDRESDVLREVQLSGLRDGGGFLTWVKSISDDGRFLTFYYPAIGRDALVPEATNLLYDVETGMLVDVRDHLSEADDGPVGSLGGVGSPDGRYVAFARQLELSDMDGIVEGLWIYDHELGSARELRIGEGAARVRSAWPLSFSEDGRYLVFASSDDTLVAGDTNDVSDVFVYDQQTGTTERINVSSEGEQADRPSGSAAEISGDGRLVLFSSRASRLVPGDSNDSDALFVHDRSIGTTTLVSAAQGGGSANHRISSGDMSTDGSIVVFSSRASNLVDGDENDEADIFVHYVESGCTRRLSENSLGEGGDRFSSNPQISGDGRYVVVLVAGEQSGGE